jgi:membrane protease YdiL (CAAX protease family)
MMNRLYKKNELLFSLVWIAVYVFGLSAADNLSKTLGMEKIITVVVSLLMSVRLFVWMRKNSLFCKYGLCRSRIPASKMLYYVPMILMISVNLWYGVSMNLSIAETVFYIISMLAVGFLEEMIFRGLLFQAMCKENVKTAVIVSSITFGIGHIVNLINGSGADLLSNGLQVGYAIAAGFLFTIIFYKTKSLLACIGTHSVLNALSVFGNEAAMTVQKEMISAAALAGISILYTIYILKLDGNRSGMEDETI